MRYSYLDNIYINLCIIFIINWPDCKKKFKNIRWLRNSICKNIFFTSNIMVFCYSWRNPWNKYWYYLYFSYRNTTRNYRFIALCKSDKIFSPVLNRSFSFIYPCFSPDYLTFNVRRISFNNRIERNYIYCYRSLFIKY